MEPTPKTDFKNRSLHLEIQYKGKTYTGMAIPLSLSCQEGNCFELAITLNNEYHGVIHCSEKGCNMYRVKDQGLVDAIGKQIYFKYRERNVSDTGLQHWFQFR